MKIIDALHNKIKNYIIKKNEAYFVCIQNDIPVTKKNIVAIKYILKTKGSDVNNFYNIEIHK